MRLVCLLLSTARFDLGKSSMFIGISEGPKSRLY